MLRSTPMAHRPFQARSALRLLPLLSLVLAILACGVNLHMGARSLSVTHRPAAQLRLAI
ncbi:MAG TPA: hypothetical protein VGP82_13270 [Ktedonobacterales bacterium]|nr:hypothetical protein [Ktedonobacterales bacterium]